MDRETERQRNREIALMQSAVVKLKQSIKVHRCMQSVHINIYIYVDKYILLQLVDRYMQQVSTA